MQTLQQERASCESGVVELSGRTAALTKWLQANEQKADNQDAANLDAEQAIVPADNLSSVALQATAEDMACADAMSALDAALQKGSIAMEPYLKQVRAVSRRQFFPRATYLKVLTMQQAAPSGSSGGGPVAGMQQQMQGLQLNPGYPPAGYPPSGWANPRPAPPGGPMLHKNGVAAYK